MMTMMTMTVMTILGAPPSIHRFVSLLFSVLRFFTPGNSSRSLLSR
jgi:hypothetical protein